MIRQIETLWEHGILGQLVRYGIAGGLATSVYASVYLPLALWVFPQGQAVFAVPFAFVTALVAGFFLHSLWSFGGYGTRENSGKQHARFLATHLVGLTLNASFTWVITGLWHMPAWTALMPSVTLTPLVTFVIQRQWVFR